MNKNILEEKLYCCEFKSEISYTDILNELMTGLELDHCVNTEVDDRESTYIVYSSSEEKIKKVQELLGKNISDWKKLDVDCTEPVLYDIKKEDWTEVWKRYFKIQKITPNVVIKASWLEYEPAGNEKVIEIDPGMSFGTGSHETTQFCLKMIEKLAENGYSSFLDAGCGSGILSIAASMFGFKPVYAFDYDEESIESSEDNFNRNNIDLNNIHISASDIADYEPGIKFDVVVANIISNVLVANSERLLSWVKPGGCLVLSGILRTEYDRIKQSFISENVVEICALTEKDWTGGVFQVGMGSN